MVSDVSLALVNSGVSLEATKTFADSNLRRQSPIVAPQRCIEAPKARPLVISREMQLPSYAHENLPAFPDRHTYIQVGCRRVCRCSSVLFIPYVQTEQASGVRLLLLLLYCNLFRPRAVPSYTWLGPLFPPLLFLISPACNHLYMIVEFVLWFCHEELAASRFLGILPVLDSPYKVDI